MALTLEQQVRLLYGDSATSPFYPLLTSDEVLWFLEQNSNNVQNAARQAAIAASFQLAGWSTRERSGNIEVWNNLANSYMKALDNFISQKVTTLPSGLMPYAAGISWVDRDANNANPDNVRPALTQVSLCDNEESFTF